MKGWEFHPGKTVYSCIKRYIMKHVCYYLLVFFLLLVAVPAVRGAVVDSTASGFTVRQEQAVSGDPDILFSKFHQDIGEWWDPAHTWSGKASNLSIQPYPNGCFCEDLENGGQVRHMTVISVDPGKMFRMEGGIGPLQQFAVSGVMTLEIKPDGDKCKVSLTYTVGGYIPGGAAKLAGVVDRVLGEQFRRFVEYATK